MANRARIAVDFPVIAPLKGLVAKEMDLVIRDAALLLGLAFKMTKAVGLVPASREDVERDLAANRVSAPGKGWT